MENFENFEISNEQILQPVTRCKKCKSIAQLVRIPPMDEKTPVKVVMICSACNSMELVDLTDFENRMKTLDKERYHSENDNLETLV